VTKVKICGITNLDDALVAIEAGADILGFNFYAKSPRFLSPEAAKVIIDKLPQHVTTVAVFVNESFDFIVETIANTGIDVIQLHGDESTSYVDALRKRIDRDVIKAFRVSDKFQVADTLDYSVHGIMLDAFSPSERGGTGEVFDWDIAKSVWTMVGQLWLAGGLTPANVGDAIREVRPYAVDVCSGVESAKGIKDPEKVRAFVKNAKNAL
jgi:phosphoribosylanthranilate isomerase